MKNYIVLCGNTADGFTFYGPFLTRDLASMWAESELENTDPWHVVALIDPMRAPAESVQA
jgi:hypothetical protein